DARDAAMTAALQRFDQKMHASVQGSEHEPRPTAQTAAPRPSSRRSSVMMRARYLAAASAVVLIAGSASWHYLAQELPSNLVQDLSRTAAPSNLASHQPPPPETPAPEEPAKPMPAQPPTTGPTVLDRIAAEEGARLDTPARKELPSLALAPPAPAPAPVPKPTAETRAS